MLFYRIVLETSGASNFRIAELHWRDFAVFVSLSSRTNTRQGLRLCDASGASRCARAAPCVGGFVLSWLERALDKREVGSSSLPRPTSLRCFAATARLALLNEGCCAVALAKASA